MMCQNLASSKQSLWCAHGAQTRELASPVQAYFVTRKPYLNFKPFLSEHQFVARVRRFPSMASTACVISLAPKQIQENNALIAIASTTSKDERHMAY